MILIAAAVIFLILIVLWFIKKNRRKPIGKTQTATQAPKTSRLNLDKTYNSSESDIIQAEIKAHDIANKFGRKK